MKIIVTTEDIRLGEPGEPCSCPVARAIQRALPHADPWVHVDCVCFDNDAPPDIPLPSEAREFIGRFDNALTVEPFEFELDVPEEQL